MRDASVRRAVVGAAAVVVAWVAGCQTPEPKAVSEVGSDRSIAAGGAGQADVAAVTIGQAARSEYAEKQLRAKAAGSDFTRHPLEVLMYAQKSAPRAGLVGKHPRVFVDEEGLKGLRQRARTTHRTLWKRVLSGLRVFNSSPPAPPAQDRRVQNVVGLGIVEAALAWQIERKPKYLEQAKKWMDFAVQYETWGYEYSKPNVDLAAGHLLYGMGWGYDLLYNDLTEEERATYRAKLVRQARLLAEHFEPRAGRRYSYSQNHVYIPTVGLGIAAYALYGEVPEAEEWARLARAVVGRSLEVYSADGYFYESLEYFVFAVPWLVQYVTAHEHFTGEVLWDLPGFRAMHEYLAHSVLPDGKHVFDFGDAFFGSDTRKGTTEDAARTHPGGKLHSNYNLLHATARWFKDSKAQGVARHMQRRGDVSWFEYMSLLWYDPSVRAAPMSALPTYRYFPDHEVVFHRSDWTEGATAVAFKCGPPEGHAALERQRRFPDWRLSSGHAHPDANSFILYGKGQYLTGDSGYSGVPRSDQQNTVLVNGEGQRFAPKGHNAFKGAPYEQLDKIRLEVVSLGPNRLELVGHAAAAYRSELGVEKFERRWTMESPAEFKIQDALVAKAPAVFTSVLHGDGDILERGALEFEIPAEGASLGVFLEAGEDLRSSTEPNFMTAPGRPGSVQKGEREARGSRLLIGNDTPLTSWELVTRLVVR